MSRSKEILIYVPAIVTLAGVVVYFQHHQFHWWLLIIPAASIPLVVIQQRRQQHWDDFYEGTREMNTLIVGKSITGLSAFV
jgi:hypothetical protein